MTLSSSVGGESVVSAKPRITKQPTSLTRARNAKATFAVTANRATRYRWQTATARRWVIVKGATHRTFTVRATPARDGARYRVVVGNPRGSVISHAATLTMRKPPVGTRTNPYRVGVTFRSGDWKLKLGRTDQDAWPRIQAANMFNDPPRKGYRYVMTAMTVTYVGKHTGLPWLNTTAQVVSKAGRTYGGDCGVLPNDLMDVEDLYHGGRATGNVCAEVPATAIRGALWRVAGDFDSYANSPYKFVKQR